MRLLLEERMPLLHNLSAGISRGHKAPSEPYIRVIATIIPPMQLSWWQPQGRTSRVEVSYMYVLIQDTGELHPPKDNDRRELALSPQLQQQVRVAAMADARSMAAQGLLFSPNWWLQMGDENKALEMTARLEAVRHVHDRPKRRKRLAEGSARACGVRRGGAG